MTRTYFKVVTSLEQEMSGAGLGYEEMYGDGFRYFWHKWEARRRVLTLNENLHLSDPLIGTYSIEERTVYDDGKHDDDFDPTAAEQLGLEVVP